MLFGNQPTSEQRIIEALAVQGKVSAEGILSTLESQNVTVSLQGLYRILQRLQRDGVLIKEKKNYTLRLPWVLELGLFVERAEETYLRDAYLSQLIPKTTGDKRCWRFTSLIKLVDIWTHLLLAASKTTIHEPKPTALCYFPHLWFAFTHTAEWLQFKKTFLSAVHRQYTLVGSQSFADKYLNAITKISEQDQTYLAPQEEWIDQNRERYTVIMNDYIITLKIDAATANTIDTLFTNINSEEDIRLIDMFEAFTNKVKASVVIKKDPVKAKRIRKKFETLFGPLEK